MPARVEMITATGEGGYTRYTRYDGYGEYARCGGDYRTVTDCLLDSWLIFGGVAESWA